jgi:hypothetical protein
MMATSRKHRVISVSDFRRALKANEHRASKCRLAAQSGVGRFSVERILGGADCLVSSLQRLAAIYGGEVCINLPPFGESPTVDGLINALPKDCDSSPPE